MINITHGIYKVSVCQERIILHKRSENAESNSEFVFKEINLDINNLSQDDQRFVRDKMLDFFENLVNIETSSGRLLDNMKTREGFSYIWGLPFFEKNYINSNYFRSLKIWIVIESLLSLNDGMEISLSNSFSKQNELQFKWTDNKNFLDIFENKFRIFLKIAFYVFYSPFYFLKEVLKTLLSSMLVKNNMDNTLDGNINKLYVFSYLNRSRPFDNKIGMVSDHWVNFDKIKALSNFNQPVVFYHMCWDELGSVSAGAKINKMNQLSHGGFVKHDLVERHVNMKMIFFVLAEYIGIVRNNLNSLSQVIEYFNRNYPSRVSFQICLCDILNSLFGPALIKTIFWNAVIKEVCSSLDKQSIVLYPQENLYWERAICYESWRRGFKSMGAPLATINKWDLRYYNSKKMASSKANYEPKYSLVNGPVSKAHLKQSRMRNTQFIKVEALRYLHLNAKKENQSRKEKGVLLIGDISVSNTMIMIDIISKTNLFDNNIYLRLHPTNQSKKFENVNLVDNSEPLISQCSNFELCIVSATSSAALDIYLSNIPSLYFMNSAEINVSPLLGYSVAFFSDISSLMKLIENFRAKPESVCPQEFFYLDKNLRYWEYALNSVTSPLSLDNHQP